MAKQKGRLLLVKIGDGQVSETFNTLCGLQTKTLTINNTEVDVTTADCTDPGSQLWTDVMEGAKRVSFTGSGLFKDRAEEARMTELVMDATPLGNFQVVVPEVGTFQGLFMFTSLEFTGELEGAMSFSVNCASAGPVTFTAAP